MPSASLASNRMVTLKRLGGSALAIALLAACSSTTDSIESATPEVTTSDSAATTGPDSATEDSDEEELFPDVVGVEVVSEGEDSWTFIVTLSSPYDGASRYADSWRVRNVDGTVYGERFLTHDHASEQPFTRQQTGIEIPFEVLSVVVQGRDQVSGWGGATMTVELDNS